MATAELQRAGLLGAADRVLDSKIVRLGRSYPVYEQGYTAPLGQIQAHVDSIEGLIAIGRYGAFKYNNQDHSILMGLLAAAQIQSGADQGLWGVNADDRYQESGEVARLFV